MMTTSEMQNSANWWFGRVDALMSAGATADAIDAALRAAHGYQAEAYEHFEESEVPDRPASWWLAAVQAAGYSSRGDWYNRRDRQVVKAAAEEAPTRFDTFNQAYRAGYITVEAAKSLCVGRILQIVDTSGPNAYGYSFEARRGEVVVASSVAIWFSQEINKVHRPGCSRTMFRVADILAAR